MGQRSYNMDAELVLAPAGTVITATGVPQDNGADIVKTVGAPVTGRGRFEGVLILDVSAIDIASSDEVYGFVLQGSTDADFSTAGNIENLASLSLGKGTARTGGTVKDSLVGRYELGFATEQADVVYPYLRLKVVAGGTTPSITFSAWIAPVDWG